MDKEAVRRVSALCTQAAEIIDGHGTFRLHVLIQLVRSELEKELVVQEARGTTTQVPPSDRIV